MEENKIVSEKFTVTIGFRYSPALYLLDISLRFLLLFYYLFYDFSVWYFLCGQFLMLLAVGYYNQYYTSKIVDRYKKLINPEYASTQPALELQENIPQKFIVAQLLIGYIFTFWFLYNIFDNHAWYMYIAIIFLSVLGTIAFGVQFIFTSLYRTKTGVTSTKVTSEKILLIDNVKKTVRRDATKNFPKILINDINFEPEDIEFDLVDQNDTKIAKLESELKNINYRSEAWMLESVFLGGLAFSGFLTVASANILGTETRAFAVFMTNISDFIFSCSSSNIDLWYTNINNHFHREDLFILIMLLCLASSVFFLLILTLRIRFNDLTLHLDHIFRVATIFNAKEEEIYNNNLDLENNPNQVARFEKIQKKIDLALIDAEKLLKKIRPVSILMNIYRTIAILLFYMVLIVSGFYFVPVISVAILSLALFTFIFRKIETYISLDEIRRRVRRHQK